MHLERQLHKDKTVSNFIPLHLYVSKGSQYTSPTRQVRWHPLSEGRAGQWVGGIGDTQHMRGLAASLPSLMPREASGFPFCISLENWWAGLS